MKKLLEALKGEPFLDEVFPDFLDAFKTLFSSSISPDNLRYLSLFVTFALQDGRMILNRPPRTSSNTAVGRLGGLKVAGSGTSSPQPSLPATPPPLGSNYLSRLELGVKVLEMYTEMLCDPSKASITDKFARAVHNKWLLFLLSESDVRVIILSLRILTRLLILNGPDFIRKFADKSGGFIILEGRLKCWWHVPAVWSICFGIMLGYDVPQQDLGLNAALPVLCMDRFDERRGILCPRMISVLFAMLESGVKAVTSSSDENGKLNNNRQDSLPVPTGGTPSGSPRLAQFPRLDIDNHGPGAITTTEQLETRNTLLQAVIMCFSQLHSQSQTFRDFELNSTFVQKLLFTLYPVAVTSDTVSVETELHSRGAALTFEGHGAVIRPRSRSPSLAPSIVRRRRGDSDVSTTSGRKVMTLRRGSSFVLLPADQAAGVLPKTTKLAASVFSSQHSAQIPLKTDHPLVEAIVSAVLNVYIDQVFQRKEFPGFGIFLKVPPGFQEHQAYFESYVLLHAMTAIQKTIEQDQKQLHEPRILTNLSRYVQHMAEAVFEGWLINGAEALLDFIGSILEYVQRPDIAQIKNVRLCVQAIGSIRTVFLRISLLRLSELEEVADATETVALLEKLTYWQTVIVSSESNEEQYMRLICYLLYTKITSKEQTIRIAAADFWRMMLVQRPDEADTMFYQVANSSQKRRLTSGLLKILELENEAFLGWIDNHREDLDSMFHGALSKAWEDFVADENKKTTDTGKNRVNRRRERLKLWQAEEQSFDNIWHRHEIGTSHWNANVYAAERTRHLRAVQDFQASVGDIAFALERFRKILQAPIHFTAVNSTPKWQLDETEGRNRMRSRLIKDRVSGLDDYQPKRKESDLMPKARLKLDTNLKPMSSKEAIGATPVDGAAPETVLSPGRQRSSSQSTDLSINVEEEYEIVADPNDDGDGFEDKNRRVMRSLQKDDQVKHVFNVSRIVGVDAVEGLLILGKDSLYLLDDLFVRADSEVVSVWQAPPEERDPYLQVIAKMSGGRGNDNAKPKNHAGDRVTRHWRWSEVISISRRRFLFRDVAIEIFFGDGRSYLLTTISNKLRDDLFNKLINYAPSVNNPASLDPEISWRLESLRNPDDVPQSLGSRFASVFNSSAWNPATRRWQKGEISNFQYLMLVNTLAGRTFNDLTQYPVFPWVLADYSSAELDLENPKTFRDLSKPMGCQTASREAELRERYKSFGEMGVDHEPYHYGTHYSSPPVVTSYLIRLEPFVRSFLLIQGGTFDYADRMFCSMEEAWKSASAGSMSDVRELIPEFFFLPEFLSNLNGYNFGVRSNGQKTDNVVLPPWAKGDPHIFIAKHREALESPYVSKHLHQWIDLVFGFKQRGEAAVEAVNVFHYLSYPGAEDVDSIEDPRKREGIISAIHNFGQTPHQIYTRPHVQRDMSVLKQNGLDTTAQGLTRVPFPLLEINERVSSMIYHNKRLLCSAAFRINIPPACEKYMEWGFADNSVRFYDASSRKMIGHFEHVHQGQVSCAIFADSKTLILAGMDCTITVCNIILSSKNVDLIPEDRVSLFGHKSPVTVLAGSRTFSTLLSASSDGRVYLWDLNRNEFVRELGRGEHPIQCARINNVTGQIVLCSTQWIFVYSLNGRLLLQQNICGSTDSDDIVYCCAFYEGVGNEWLEKNLLFTGHRRGIVNVSFCLS